MTEGFVAGADGWSVLTSRLVGRKIYHGMFYLLLKSFPDLIWLSGQSSSTLNWKVKLMNIQTTGQLCGGGNQSNSIMFNGLSIGMVGTEMQVLNQTGTEGMEGSRGRTEGS